MPAVVEALGSSGLERGYPTSVGLNVGVKCEVRDRSGLRQRPHRRWRPVPPGCDRGIGHAGASKTTAGHSGPTSPRSRPPTALRGQGLLPPSPEQTHHLCGGPSITNICGERGSSISTSSRRLKSSRRNSNTLRSSRPCAQRNSSMPTGVKE